MKMMKKMLSVLMIAVMMMTMLSGMVISHASGNVYATGDLNIRKGPSLNHSLVSFAKKGAVLTFLDNTERDSRGVDWYQVSYKGHTGWVSSTYASLKAPASGKTSASGTAYVNGNVNIRKGAGTGYPAIGSAPKGSKISYLGVSTQDERGITWYKVSHKGVTGWASSNYVSLKGFNNDGPRYLGTFVKATGGTVNIRKAAGTDQPAIGTMPKGAIANYADASANDVRGVTWYKVSFNGVIGWVSSAYTSLY